MTATAYEGNRGWAVSHTHRDHEIVDRLDEETAKAYADWYNGHGFPWFFDVLGQWGNDDMDAAALEGWDLFESFGSYAGPLQIQSFDVKGEIEGGVDLEDDTAAWQLVVDKAAAGSPLHLKALKHLAVHNPLELFNMTRELGVPVATIATKEGH